MGYNGYTEKKKASNEKYLAKFVKPTIRMTEDEKREIEEGAEAAGKSFNRYVVDCALEKGEDKTMDVYGIGYDPDNKKAIRLEARYDHTEYGAYNESKAYSALKQEAAKKGNLLVVCIMGRGSTYTYVECPDLYNRLEDNEKNRIIEIFYPNYRDGVTCENAIDNVKKISAETAESIF